VSYEHAAFPVILDHFGSLVASISWLFCIHSPPVSLRFHGGRHLGETSDVTSGDQAWELALRGLHVRLRRFEPVLEAIFHDSLELRIDFLGCPANTLGVLCHLEPRDGDTTSVGRFAYTRNLCQY